MQESMVSCIVPVFNGERFLIEALESIIAQIYRPIEIIVIDDGSTDGTKDIAAKYGQLIRYFYLCNQGSATAKNQGIKAARGDFIAFLDADDLWHPEKLARQMARFRERTDIDLCFTRFQNFWMPELGEEKKHYARHPMAQPLSAWSICTLLTPRTSFVKFGNFDDGLRGNENMLWYLRAKKQGAIIEILPDVLMHRRFHLNNDTRRGRSHMFDLFFPILKMWRDYQLQQIEKEG